MQSQADGGAGEHNQAASAEYYLQHYRLGRKIGVGSFGKVKLAEHIPTNHKVAIKILNRKKIQAMDMEEKVRREIKILLLFMHPHIVRVYEIIETATDIYVVMEYVKSGELFDYIVEKGRLIESEARHFFQQIISGVEYCHRNMVVHRDLKPENLLLDSKYRIKIADFGLSNVMRDGHFLKTSCGSPNYAAPEVISGKLYSGPEVDVWSCGVILYALLCGSLPFDDENIPQLFRKIKQGIYSLPNYLTPGARDLIGRMLEVDPLKRITIPEIRQHSWFKTSLPRYLAVMQADTIMTAPRVDGEILEQVVRLGFTRTDVENAVRNRVQNKDSVAYYLLLDNRKSVTQDAYLQHDIEESSLLYPQGVMGPQPTAASPGQPGQQLAALQQHLQAGVSATQSAAGGATAGAAGAAAAGGAAYPSRVEAHTRWNLGIPVASYPQQAFNELARVMDMLGIRWKRQGPYNIKCLACATLQPLPAGVNAAANGNAKDAEIMAADDDATIADMAPDNAAAGCGPGSRVKEIKFEVQMYKVKADEYFLDFQRLDGDYYIFIDICAQVMCNLRLANGQTAGAC